MAFVPGIQEVCQITIFLNKFLITTMSKKSLSAFLFCFIHNIRKHMKTISPPPRSGPWVMLTGFKKKIIINTKNQASINHITKTIDFIDLGPWPIDFWGSIYYKGTFKLRKFAKKFLTLAPPSVSVQSRITLT